MSLKLININVAPLNKVSTLPQPDPTKYEDPKNKLKVPLVKQPSIKKSTLQTLNRN